MNYRSGIHQGPAQGVFDTFYDRVCLLQYWKGMLRVFCREDAAGQTRGIAADGDQVCRAFPGQVRQRAGFRKAGVSLVARVTHGPGKQVAAESARRQVDDLAVFQVGRQFPRQGFMDRRRQGNDDQFNAVYRCRQVGRNPVDFHVPFAFAVEDGNGFGFQYRFESLPVAAPETHVVTLFGKCRGGGITAMSAAEYG